MQALTRHIALPGHWHPEARRCRSFFPLSAVSWPGHGLPSCCWTAGNGRIVHLGRGYGELWL